MIQTSKGILVLSKKTFIEVWFRYCELASISANDEWRIPMQERFKLDGQALFSSDFYWTPNEKDGITAFDRKTWKEVIKVPMLGKNIKVVNGKYIDYSDNRIKIISVY